VWRNPARRIDIARSWALAKAEYAALAAERDRLREELQWMRQSRDEILGALQELRADVTARWQAEARLAEHYRERAIARANAAERDPNATLN
jgi:hypothetical protein